MTQDAAHVTYRPGSSADSLAAFRIFRTSLADLLSRRGQPEAIATDETALAEAWPFWRPIFEHLARTHDQFWIAEWDGRPAGYARTIVRDGLQQLTEFFVAPGAQAAGIGRGLLSRAFADQGARHRAIIATVDPPAQALYLKAGLYPRFHLSAFGRVPEPIVWQSDLQILPLQAADLQALEALALIDRLLLDHRRDVEHQWLLTNRQGYLYLRDGRPVGYGYVGEASGPFALVEASDFPAVLAHAENSAALANREWFGLEVPMVNRTAVDYLLGRGFRIETFLALMMLDQPFGRFENYIVTRPPFFL